MWSRTTWCLVATTCLLHVSHVSRGQNSTFTWQDHLQFGGVDTGIQWRTAGEDGNVSVPCLGVCTCKDDLADCSNRGLEEVPDQESDIVIRTL